MTYDELEQATVKWAQARTDIRAVLAIGSRGRREHPADEWSDLDVILLTTDVRPYANEAWVSAIGAVWVAYVEEANPGDPDVQVVFEGGLKGDFTFVRVENAVRPLDELLPELHYQGVFSRGGRIIFDRNGSARPLPESAVAAPILPTEQEYLRLINGFWLNALRMAKYARRGDLWRAMRNLVANLSERLLTLIEWQAQGNGADTWYDGRFMADWADQHALEALPKTFARYDSADLRRALLETIELFRTLAQQVANQLGFTYPSEMDQRISQMIQEV